MTDKNIQLKIHTGNGQFDELFPVTKAELVEVGNKKLDETLQDVTSQLAQKITQGTGGVTDADLSQNVKELMTGGSVAVVGKNTILEENIVNGQVTAIKTDFLEIGSSNSFNKETIELDKYVNTSNGDIQTLTNFFVSDFIPILSLMPYIINVARQYVFYDGNKNYISGTSVASPFSNVSFTSPENARFIRFSLNYGAYAVDNARINMGSTLLPYEKFYYVAKQIKPTIMDEQITNQHIRPKELTSDKLAFIVPEAVVGKNRFNKETVTLGEYVNWVTGALATNEQYDASDLIAAEPLTTYSRKENSHIAFYDKNHVFINGLQMSGLSFTTPENTAFIQISVPKTGTDTEQLEEGSTSTTYEKFGYNLPGFIQKQNEQEVSVKINLPTKIYALVGQELNIYFDNIVNVTDLEYDFDVISTVGQQYKDFYRFTPSVSGSHEIKITVSKNDIELVSKTSTIFVSDASVGTGVNKKLLLIGDSTTNNGFPSIKLNENFSTDPMNITLLGTRGTAPDLHEGRSGWKAQHYVSSAELSGITNAFWNPTTSKFDFSYYISKNTVTTPDYVIINLGINDVFGYGDDGSLNAEIAMVISRYNTMISSIKAHSPNIKIGIALTIPPNYSQDAFSRPYGTGQTRERYKRNNFLFVKKLIETYQERESENLFLVPIYLNLDTRYGFGIETIQVNKRDTRKMEITVANGGVHPGVSGYWQIADSIWFWLKSFE